MLRSQESNRKIEAISPNTCDGIKWCKECDVPIFGTVCESCGSKGIYCGKDFKPVFEKERQILQHYFPIALPDVIYRNKNRVIFKGQTLFHFKVDEKGSSLYPVEPIEKIRDKLKEESNNRWKNNLEQIEKSNSVFMKEKERTAIELIKELAEENADRFKLVSFAGGKDSAVVSLLVQKALGSVPLFFADTTLEYPETYCFVTEFADTYKMKLIKDQNEEFYHSPQDFFELCKKLGPPSIRYRWCCYVFKANPISRFYQDLNEDVLAFSGIRRRESASRMKLGYLSKSNKIARQILAHPILDWKEAEVWQYLLQNKIIFNPLYELGHARVGCWPCPNTGCTMCFFRKVTHPELCKRLGRMLTEFAERNGEPKSWVQEGLWRIRRNARNNQILRPYNITKEDNNLKIEYKINLDLSRIEHLKPFGNLEFHEVKGSYRFEIQSGSLCLEGEFGKDGGRLALLCSPRDYLEKKLIFEKQLTKAINCIGCGGCTGSCPNGAMNIVNGHLVIDKGRCNGCCICAKQNCMVLKFGHDRVSVNADLFYMSPCSEGRPMNHLIFYDAGIGLDFAARLEEEGLPIEIHDEGHVVCVGKSKTKMKIERIVFNQQTNKKSTNKKTNKRLYA